MKTAKKEGLCPYCGHESDWEHMRKWAGYVGKSPPLSVWECSSCHREYWVRLLRRKRKTIESERASR